MIIRAAIRAPLTIIISLFFSISISPKLSLIFLCIIPILGIGLFAIIRHVHPTMKKVFRTYDKLNNVVEENVSGIRVVKSFVIEEKEKQKFGKVSNSIYTDFTKAEKILALNNPLMQFSIYICILAISWFGAKIIVNTGMAELTTGELMTMFTYTIQILSSLMMFSMILVMITISKSSLERIVEVLDEVPDIQNPENPVTEVKDGSIEFKDVSFSYVNDANKECLKNINLEIKSGETVGIIGGTGSGKSSLVNLIPRLYDVTEGELLVGNQNVKNYDIETLRCEVSCVLQKNVLFSGTIKDNIKWGKENATDEEVIEAAKLANAHGFIERLPQGYDTMLTGNGANLSQGQRQLLSIARVAVNDPPVMILDEATSSIDTRTEKIVQDGMDKLMEGRTVLVIAHRLSTVRNSKAIMVMANGRIIERGNHEDLIAEKGEYYQLYTGAFELE